MRRIHIAVSTGASLGIAVAVCAAASAAAASNAGTKTSALNASRAQVAATCDSHGGSSYGTGASHEPYGCVRPDGAYLDCDVNGLCEGGMPAKHEANGERGATGSAQRPYGK